MKTYSRDEDIERRWKPNIFKTSHSGELRDDTIPVILSFFGAEGALAAFMLGELVAYRGILKPAYEAFKACSSGLFPQKTPDSVIKEYPDSPVFTPWRHCRQLGATPVTRRPHKSAAPSRALGALQFAQRSSGVSALSWLRHVLCLAGWHPLNSQKSTVSSRAPEQPGVRLTSQEGEEW